MKTIGLNKKSLLYLGVILIIALLVFAELFFYLSRKTQTPEIKAPAKPTQEEIIKSLSAPAGPPVSLPKEVLKNLTVPSGKQIKIPADALKNLTVPK